MCGVFGYVSSNGRKPDLKRLAAVAQVTERRGPHAFGFAWIDGRGRLRMFKQTGRISDNLAMLAMADDAQMLIGHCRWATQGDPENNLNNHPHSADGGWIVHNGMIPTYRRLQRTHDLAPVTDCDTEALAQLVEVAPSNATLARRCAWAVEQLGTAPAVLLGLWSKPGRLVAVRSGNPLCWSQAKEGTYLASLPEAMPAGVRSVDDGNVLSFRLDAKGSADVQVTRTRTAPRTRTASALWS